jgi:predicted  nucleic acid-binding Zn-ribbon protein
MTETIQLDRDALHATFDTWTAAEESLDAQLNESLEALSAFQSHLDGWQRELAAERTALIEAREQFERDQAAAAASQANSPADGGEELIAARQKVAELSSSLVARTEELRSTDQRRAELVNELELVRAREKELMSALDHEKQQHNHERAQLAEDLRLARVTLAQHGITADSAAPGGAAGAPSKSPFGLPRNSNTHRDRSGGAVLGSIVEQFGKLRQQRAVDREASKKTR